MKPCWHCQDTDSCACIECGTATQEGWIAGRCQFCKARAFHAQYAHIIAAHDPLDRRNWEYHPAADGNRSRHIYKPLKGLQ